MRRVQTVSKKEKKSHCIARFISPLCDTLNTFAYNAFTCGEVLQRPTAGFLCFFPLARLKQRQVSLQRFGVDQPARPTGLWILSDREVKVTLGRIKNRPSVCPLPLVHVFAHICIFTHKVHSLPYTSGICVLHVYIQTVQLSFFFFLL